MGATTLQADRSADRSAAQRAGARMDWPLVGRAEEIRTIARILNGTRPRGVVLAGPSGVGKTRLARESVHLATKAGMGVTWLTATRASSQVPLGSLASLLPTVDGATERVESRAYLLRCATASLMAKAGRRGSAIFIDDAHWLDDTSAALIQQLVAQGSAHVVATLRRGEPAPEAITALWKDGLAARMDVAGLDGQSVTELLTTTLGGQLDTAAATYFSDKCSGNALFLRELVNSALDSRALTCQGGLWRLSGGFSPSERLAELIEGRLMGLGTAERSLLELVAYAEVLSTAELAHFAPPGVAEQLERSGLLAITASGRGLQVHLAHPVYGDVLRARLPELAMRSMARRLAETVESVGVRSGEDALRVSMWHLDSGNGTADQLLRGAMNARWNYRFDLADRLVEAALAAGAGFDAKLLQAQLSSLRGQAESAEVQLEKLWLQAQTDDERGIVAIRRVENLVFYLGRNHDGLRLISEATARISDPNWLDELMARKAAVQLTTDGFATSAATASDRLPRASGAALLWACETAAFALSRTGQTTQALRILDRGIAAVAEIEGYDWYPWIFLWVRCEVLVQDGRLREAAALAASEYERGLQSGSDEARGYFAAQRARAALDTGQVEKAAHNAREAVALLEQLGRPAFARIARIHLAQALALTGRCAEAQIVLDELNTQNIEPASWIQLDLALARGWTAIASGQLREAHDALRSSANLAEECGDVVGSAIAWHTIARTGGAEQTWSKLETLAAHVDNAIVPLRAAHAKLIAMRDAPGLLTMSATFDEMGATLLAAEAAAEASVIWRTANEPQQSVAAQRRSNELSRQCAQAHTPALQSGQARAILTAAEHETALLAARGRTNREIADALLLSIRTVENRLQRIYEKVGISGRAQLADFMH